MELLAELGEQKRKVDFNTYDISVKELISMYGDRLIDIAPEYQRQFRWDDSRQSSLIESIFLGIPIPSLFMATNIDGTWELIDGVQRLSSIIHFAGNNQIILKAKMKNNLILKGIEKLKSFNNKGFYDLPKSVQLDFLLKPLKITTLSDKSDLEVRFDLFERLNTGGVRLTDQEIRSCIFRGEFNDFLRDLAKDQNFHKAVKLPKPSESDGTREEFVLRFFAFLNNYKNFDHSVVDFLNNYMRDASKSFNYKKNENIFRETFRALAGLPKGIVRKRKQTPVNLFEGVAVGAGLAYLKNKTININNFDIWVLDENLRNSTTGATNTRSKVIDRIEFCMDKFLENV